MAADKPLCLCGAVKAASKTNKEKGPTRPAPRLIPSGAKRREALALGKETIGVFDGASHLDALCPPAIASLVVWRQRTTTRK